jgi:hypothetical protein
VQKYLFLRSSHTALSLSNYKKMGHIQTDDIKQVRNEAEPCLLKSN